jgi:hypothetical protein
MTSEYTQRGMSRYSVSTIVGKTKDGQWAGLRTTVVET